MNRRERRAADKTARQEPGAPLRRALTLYQNGKLVEAERAYRAILARAPGDANALYQLGILLGQVGRLPEAERCLVDACQFEPYAPAFHHGLGLLRALQGRYQDALACHDKALALDPGQVAALAGRAAALHELGDLAAAEAAYRRAAALAPHAPEIRFGWASVLADLGRLPEAALRYRELLTLDPKSPEAHFNLGTVLRDVDQLEDAATAFRQALVLKPDMPHAAIDLVSALSALGKHREALDQGLSAMRRDSASADARQAFSLAVARGVPVDYNAEICGFLKLCLAAENLEREDLAPSAAWQLRQVYGIDGSAVTAGHALDEARAGRGCLVDPLLHQLLAGTVNTDLELEAFLTQVRRVICLTPELPETLDEFLTALALQAFNNAYIWVAADDEAAQVAALKSAISVELSRNAPVNRALVQELLRFALYEPLSALDGEKLLEAAARTGSPLRRVVERTIAEPLEEARLAREIHKLGTIENPVSRAVREQYEANPYPRWFALPRLTPVSLAVMLRRKFPRASLPPFLEGPVEILVAGCGTGRQAIATALSFTQARVLAVDLSLASLGYAQRMALRRGASNLSFLQADLLVLDRLGREFAMVEAVGVLHHMEDPLAGWRALCDLLRPGGFMRIGLYSALARADVVAARERIAALGLAPRARDIGTFRHRLLFGEEAERLPRLARSKDMFDLNGCRDLLFHTKEHRYTPLDLRDMVARLGLEFVGFEHADPAVAGRYRAEHPGDPAMTDLARWARFEDNHRDAFSGMYVFWCRKPPVPPTQ